MTTIPAERPDTEVAVILGVDTHLDFHVGVAVDHLGRRLGVSSVPTTLKGYERLLRWAKGFGPLRCAGVEGTSRATGPDSPATGGPGGSRCLRWSARSAGGEARAVTSRSPTPPTPSAPRERGIGRRSLGRAQERRRARGDDQGPALGPPLRDQG
jgi:hypothetical protein